MSVDMAWGAMQDEAAAPDTSYADQYRVLSSQAVASCAFGLLGISNLLCYQYGMAISVVPLLGLFLGLRAIWIIRRSPREYTGYRLAVVGTALSTLFLFGGWGLAGYVYATELREGYERINYDLLTPQDKNSTEMIPPVAQALDGKQVFIKGYVYPGAQTNGIKQFVLCRDNGDCCFGGQPKIHDMILVTLKDPLRLTYSTRLQRLHGVFHVKPTTDTVDGRGQVLYQLEAEYLD